MEGACYYWAAAAWQLPRQRFGLPSECRAQAQQMLGALSKQTHAVSREQLVPEEAVCHLRYGALGNFEGCNLG